MSETKHAGPWGDTVHGGPWTRHGHSIPGKTVAGERRPSNVARCGGVRMCATCQSDAAQAVTPRTADDIRRDAEHLARHFEENFRPMNETTDRTTATDEEFRARVARFEDGGNRERAAELWAGYGAGLRRDDLVADLAAALDAAEDRGRAEVAARVEDTVAMLLRSPGLYGSGFIATCFRDAIADLPAPASEAGDAR